MKLDTSINLRLPASMRAALDMKAAEWSEDYGVELTSADLLRIGAKRILASPGELFRPPASGVPR
jgi:hypothetical protein